MPKQQSFQRVQERDWLTAAGAATVNSANHDDVARFAAEIEARAQAESIDLKMGVKAHGYKKLEDYILDVMDEQGE